MLLAVDTSTVWTGLALFDGVQVRAETIWETRRHHTVELAPAVDTLLKRCDLKPTDLEALAVALGPGSFTSLRIGLALVKGMALALHIPVIGIPTLDFLAVSIPVQRLPMVAVLQAGRNRLAAVRYTAEGLHWRAQGEPQITTAEELAQQIQGQTLVCGELSATERQTLRRQKGVVLASPAQCLRRPSYLAEMAWMRLRANQVDDVVSLAPVYVHVAEAIPA